MTTLPVGIRYVHETTLQKLEESVNIVMGHNTISSYWMPGVNTPYKSIEGWWVQTLIRYERYGND